MADLRDFLQSMSNTAASNVSAPVDGINWLLRKAGMPVSDAPFMGSDWMAQKGLTQPVQQGAASILGETAGLLAPAAVAAKAPQIARGLLQMGDNAMAPRTLNPQTGAIVWHGSPHKFDKFDSSKIGTGEGAQAYGHGLYLAESPDVANMYKEALSKYDVPPTGPVQFAHNILQSTKHASRTEELLRKSHPQLSNEEVASTIQQASEALAKGKQGQLYKVDLPDEHIAKMLDWDKPLIQQHPDVQKALSMIDGDTWHPSGGDYDAAELGQSIYHRLTSQGRDAAITAGRNAQTTLGASQAKAAEDLRAFGIPGIRYLDGGSRGAGTGSSNFVVFPGNEDILKIMERNGQGLLGN